MDVTDIRSFCSDKLDERFEGAVGTSEDRIRNYFDDEPNVPNYTEVIQKLSESTSGRRLTKNAAELWHTFLMYLMEILTRAHNNELSLSCIVNNMRTIFSENIRKHCEIHINKRLEEHREKTLPPEGEDVEGEESVTPSRRKQMKRKLSLE